MAGMAALAARLAELEDIPSKIAQEVADGITEEIRQEFDGGHDPYGHAWSPLKASTLRRKRGDARILRRSDVMSSETVARPSRGAGVEVVSVDYGEHHQTGTASNDMDARPVLPDGDELPESWQEIIEDATARAVRKTMGR